MTEGVAQCRGVTAADTYHAEGVMGGGRRTGRRRRRRRRGSAEWQSCLGVMLAAGPCDDRELPSGDKGHGNRVPLQMYPLFVCVCLCEWTCM